MIQADQKLTLAADGCVGIIETSVLADDETDEKQVTAAIFASQQILNRCIAPALALDAAHEAGSSVPDTVPENLATD